MSGPPEYAAEANMGAAESGTSALRHLFVLVEHNPPAHDRDANLGAVSSSSAAIG
ncbi:MAG: hypothetical protein R6X02_20160 [Enhygromyxa sp.]